MPYSTRTDLENRFGQRNIAKWADADNMGEFTHITERINWAIQTADDMIDNKLRSSPWPVPFEAPVPFMIQDISARWAGVTLYDTRLIVDANDSEDAVMPHKEYVKKILNGLHSGQIELDLTLRESVMYPTVVDIFEEEQPKYY